MKGDKDTTSIVRIFLTIEKSKGHDSQKRKKKVRVY